MFCENCGTKLRDGAKFCNKCGYNMAQPVYPHYNLQPTPPGSAKQSNSALPAIIISSVIIVVTIIAMILLFVMPGYLRADYRKDKENPSLAEGSSEPDSSSLITADNSSDSPAEQDEASKDSSNGSEADASATTDKAASDSSDSSNNTDKSEKASTEEVTTEDPEIVLAEFIASMSTDDQPNIADFFWYTECVIHDGIPSDAIYFSKHPLANGGWKMYMLNDPYYKANNHSEMWMNADIETEDDDINACVTIKWGNLFDGSGESVDQSGEVTEFYGSWENKNLVVKDAAWGTLTLTDFYSKGINQFILGTFDWIDGTSAYVAMVRPGRKIEYEISENRINFYAYDQSITEATTQITTQATTQATTEAVILDPTPPPPPQEPYDIGIILERCAQFTRSQYADVIEIEQSGELYIHCYDEIVDDTGVHMVTNDWLTIDPATLTGYNFMWDYVDLR